MEVNSLTKEEYIQDFDRVYWPRIKDVCSPNTKEILLTKGFFDAPASTKYHGNYAGGLCEHSYNVTDSLVFMTEALYLGWERPESPYIVGLFHDLCKCDQYVENQPRHFIYRDDMLFGGHGEKSVYIISGFMKLSREEAMAINWHMGPYDTRVVGGSFALSDAFKKFPLCLMMFLADISSSYLDETIKK